MEKLAEKSTFETSNKAPRRPRGLFLRLLRFLFNLSLISIVGALSAVSGMYGYVLYVHAEELGRTYPDLVENSFVYDADGGRIGEIKARENRRTVGEEDLGELLPRAVVAVEDRRFYEHWGVDFAGISRAAWEDIRELDVNQGG